VFEPAIVGNIPIMKVADLVKALAAVDPDHIVVAADDIHGIELVPRHLLRQKDMELVKIEIRGLNLRADGPGDG
jgi:hypothetical protein